MKQDMIYAFDTYYFDDHAHTVCIVFEEWTSEKETRIFMEKTETASGYESGAFYKRELPCILSLLKQIKLHEGDLIIVDGYVTLGNGGKMGLGGYLYEALEERFPVIGIAKNEFNTPDLEWKMIFRGESETPLFLTVRGADADEIKAKVEKMHGNFRMPALLKKLDQLTRMR